MGLFGRRAGNEDDPRPLAQRVLALPRLLAHLPRENASVLDLGAANPQTVEFFTSRGAQITVADLFRSAAPMRCGGPRPPRIFQNLLSYDPSSRFDLVLAWDVLNYLFPEELSHLMSSLNPYLRPGTQMHALVAAGHEMPVSPAVYRIENESTVTYEPSAEESRPSPGYAEPGLLKLMRGLAVEKRFQLRNGSVEYAFSYRMRPPLRRATAIVPHSRLERVPRWSRASSG
ncbi:MAG TPA: methyltransferase domain-containing protein [Vicinamibacteria bacterium]|nr:methyltransferase domain-containing protein [Vicinamibacteria bacterium]